MRILIHGTNFWPELIGIGKFSGDMAQWLALQGHEVRVVTAPPYYPQWKMLGYANRWQVEKPSLGASIRVDTPLNVNQTHTVGSLLVFRCPLWIPSTPSGLKRIMHLASFALSSFPIMLAQIFWRPEVVMVVEPPLFCSPQAWLVARLAGSKVWLHIQDYEVDAAFDLGLLKGTVLRRMVTTCEKWLMRRFDRVSTISQRMLGRAIVKGVAPERVVLFPNWVDLETLTFDSVGASRFKVELGIATDAVVALYSGNMGGKQGLEILAQAAKLLRNEPNLIFVFCGNGAGKNDLLVLCEGLSNVRFLDLQPLESLGDLLSMADIHLLPQRADAADLMMPSKLTGMLASGRPVVATAHQNTELANVVMGRGLVVAPEQPREFADAIVVLKRDAELRQLLGTAGRVYAKSNLDRDVVLRDLECEMERLISASTSRSAST